MIRSRMLCFVLTIVIGLTATLNAQELKSVNLSDYETLALALKQGTIKNLIVVDVRPRDQYKAGHIPKAINLPLDEIWDKVPAKSGVQPVLVLYGRPASVDVRKAHDILTSNGFTNVIIFGSITLWKGDLQ